MATADGDFQAYGTEHLVVLAIFAVGCVVAVWLGRRLRGTPGAPVVSKVLAVAIACVTVPLQLLQLTPDEWSLTTSLPLQLCDLAWVVAVVALWRHSRLAATVTWLWGITLTSQGMLTPDLASTFPEPRFLMFWGMHVLIIWAAFYLTPGLGLAPTWVLYRRTVALTLAWAAATFCFNVVAGTNYGYLNRKPSRGSLLDVLGPWPLYVVLEIAIVAVVWALLTWPFARTARPPVAAPASP